MSTLGPGPGLTRVRSPSTLLPVEPAPPTLARVRRAVHALRDHERAQRMLPYFGVSRGGYGEGDVFLGLGVPAVRRLAATYREAPPWVRLELLASPVHEERLLALLLMMRAYRDGDHDQRTVVFRELLANRRRVNNWDLVDTAAPPIVGAYLLEEGGLRARPRLLETLSSSRTLWDRRIALLSTLPMIRAGWFDWTLRLAERLLEDREELIHKAAGWMLREVGKRDREAMEGFLRDHCHTMPRTMLRYAVERLPPARRAAFMAGRPPGP